MQALFLSLTINLLKIVFFCNRGIMSYEGIFFLCKSVFRKKWRCDILLHPSLSHFQYLKENRWRFSLPRFYLWTLMKIESQSEQVSRKSKNQSLERYLLTSRLFAFFTMWYFTATFLLLQASGLRFVTYDRLRLPRTGENERRRTCVRLFLSGQNESAILAFERYEPVTLAIPSG